MKSFKNFVMYCVSSIALKIQIFPDDENEWSEIKSCEPLILMGPKRRLVHLKRLCNMRLKRRMSTVVDCSLADSSISEFSDTKPLLDVDCSILDYAEIADDDCEVVADVDLWDELPSEEGVDDVEIEPPPFERSEEVIAAIHDSVAKWRSPGYNTHIPGYGTSRATHYRREALRKEAVLAASSSHCMDKYLKKVDYADDIIETPVCAPCDESVVPVNCTHREAVE